jgi:hypothetical protein
MLFLSLNPAPDPFVGAANTWVRPYRESGRSKMLILASLFSGGWGVIQIAAPSPEVVTAVASSGEGAAGGSCNKKKYLNDKYVAIPAFIRTIQFVHLQMYRKYLNIYSFFKKRLIIFSVAIIAS